MSSFFPEWYCLAVIWQQMRNKIKWLQIMLHVDRISCVLWRSRRLSQGSLGMMDMFLVLMRVTKSFLFLLWALQLRLQSFICRSEITLLRRQTKKQDKVNLVSFLAQGPAGWVLAFVQSGDWIFAKNALSFLLVIISLVIPGADILRKAKNTSTFAGRRWMNRLFSVWGKFCQR